MLYAMSQQWSTARLAELGQLVRRARVSMGMSADAAAARVGMSPVTWGRVEGGHRVRGLTYAGVERALAWQSGSIEGFLRGGDEPRGEPKARDLDDLAEDINLVLDEPDLTEAEKGEIVGILRAEWEREQAETRRRRHERARTTIDMWRRARGA